MSDTGLSLGSLCPQTGMSVLGHIGRDTDGRVRSTRLEIDQFDQWANPSPATFPTWCYSSADVISDLAA